MTIRGCAAAACLILGACSSGGDGVELSIDKSVVYGADFGNASFSELETGALSLLDAIEFVDPSASLPASGVVSYDGFMALSQGLEDSDPGLIGEMRLLTDFGNERIDGKAINFYYSEFDALGNPIGVPDPREGTIFIAAEGFDDPLVENILMSGDLEVQGALRDVSGQMQGVFFGPNGEYLLAFDETTQIEGAGTYYSVFAVER